jgi:hypothetical protein
MAEARATVSLPTVIAAWLKIMVRVMRSMTTAASTQDPSGIGAR